MRKAPDDACAGQILSHYGMLLFRRPLTDDELKSAGGAGRAAGQEARSDFYAGLRYGLAEPVAVAGLSVPQGSGGAGGGQESYTLDPIAGRRGCAI